MRICSTIAVACVIALGMYTSVYASGGVYIDDLTLKNSGTVVFSDNFDSGNLAGWYSATDASLSSSHCSSGDCSLYENSHGVTTARISTSLSVSNPGLLELNFNVWLPDASEQWNSGSSSDITGLCIALVSTTGNQVYQSGLLLYPGASQYATYINGVRNNYLTCLGGTWQSITVKLDPNAISCPPAGTGQILTNNVNPLYSTYGPLTSVDRIIISTTFGDNQPVPEPSSVLPLAGGVVGMAGLVVRRKNRYCTI